MHPAKKRALTYIMKLLQERSKVSVGGSTLRP